MKALLLPFAPGPGMAHVGACLAVGEELAARGHDVVLGYGGSRPELLGGGAVRVVEADEIPYERTASRPRIDHWYPDSADLLARVQADLELIAGERPDVVVTDARIPAQIAAQASGVPHVSINHFLPNTGMTAWTTPRARLRALRRPAHTLSRLPQLARGDAHGATRLGSRVNEVRASLGLDPATSLFAGQITLATTTPLLDPAPRLPAAWRYVGPITWSVPAGAAPPDRRGGRPFVYVSQGSIGAPGRLRAIARELSREPVEGMIATMGACDPAELRSLAPNLDAANCVDNDAWLRAADVAVLHGGHLTVSAAACAGVPVIVLPDGRDHWAWAARVETFGTGIALRSPRTPGAIRRAVRRVLREPRFRERAAELARHLAGWDGRSLAAAAIEDAVDRVAA